MPIDGKQIQRVTRASRHGRWLRVQLEGSSAKTIQTRGGRIRVRYDAVVDQIPGDTKGGEGGG